MYIDFLKNIYEALPEFSRSVTFSLCDKNEITGIDFNN